MNSEKCFPVNEPVHCLVCNSYPISTLRRIYFRTRNCLIFRGGVQNGFQIVKQTKWFIRGDSVESYPKGYHTKCLSLFCMFLKFVYNAISTCKVTYHWKIQMKRVLKEYEYVFLKLSEHSVGKKNDEKTSTKLILAFAIERRFH